MLLGSWPVLAEVVLDASVERLDLPRHSGGAFLWGDIWIQWLGETRMEVEMEMEMEVTWTETSVDLESAENSPSETLTRAAASRFPSTRTPARPTRR